MTTSTKPVKTAFKPGKMIVYVLSELYDLVLAGKLSRVFDFQRAERNLGLMLPFMIDSPDIDASEVAKVVPADSEEAIKAYGKAYLKDRSLVIIVTNPGKLKEVGFNDPRAWFGTVPTVGRTSEGDNLNAGAHRTVGGWLACQDFTQAGVPLDASKVKVQVTLVEGHMARHGTLENKGREDDVASEDVETLYREWMVNPKERREFFAMARIKVGKSKGSKGIHYAHRIFRLIFGFKFKLDASVKVFDPKTGKNTIKVEGTDHCDRPAETRYAEIDGVDTLGKSLKAHYKASLDVAGITKVEDLPSNVTEAWPFRLTYPRMASLGNAIMADCYRAKGDPKIMALEAHKRPYFSEAWECFKAEGWAKSSSKAKAKKPVANPGAAEEIELMVKGSSEEVQAKAKEIADMFKSGQIAPNLLGILEAAANSVSRADFYREIDHVLSPEGTEKVSEAEANKAAKAAVDSVLS